MTGAVILSAGCSSRFGRPKQLIVFEGQTLIRRIVDAASGAHCSPVVVVTGDNGDEVARELESTNAILAKNENWSRGIGTSIHCGVRHVVEIAPDVDAIVLLVCDQPFVGAPVIDQLVSRRTEKPIVASAYNGTVGVPALFDCSCFNELLAVDDASGAKTIILHDPNRVATFPFPAGEIDIDTTEDLQHLGSVEREVRARW